MTDPSQYSLTVLKYNNMKTEYGEIRIFPTRDIDARIAAVEAFENMAERYPIQGAEHIVGQILQSLIGLDPDGAITVYNTATNRIL